MFRGLLSLAHRVQRRLYDPWSFGEALRRAAKRGTTVSTIVDVGASDGRWSANARRFFPKTHCLLVEAQSIHEPALKRRCSRTPNMEYVLCAAGPCRSTVQFDVSDPFGGQAAPDTGASGSQNRRITELPQMAIDDLVKERTLKPPFLLKLDTHGYEVPILEGAVETLKQSSLVMIEVYNFNLSSQATRFPQFCTYMEGKGFRCADLADPMSRKRDGALWQMDLLFAPADSPMFGSNDY